MKDLMSSLESVRNRNRLMQSTVAKSLNISQGHYSKLVTGNTQPSPRLTKRIEIWLQENGADEVEFDTAKRMQDLAESIQSQCLELMRLASLNNKPSSTTPHGTKKQM